MIRESDILHETPHGYWVLRLPTAYQVMIPGHVCAVTDSAYPRTSDGLSNAIARSNYLDRRLSR